MQNSNKSDFTPATNGHIIQGMAIFCHNLHGFLTYLQYKAFLLSCKYYHSHNNEHDSYKK